MFDKLGERMKEFYENKTRLFLPRRTYTIIRIDGKAFHTYCKQLQKPFDTQLVLDMNKTTKYLCENIQGAKFGFTQSDEISILLTDFDELNTDAWFGGNVQKIASVSSSMATAYFNEMRIKRYPIAELKFVEKIPFKLALFDSRTWTIPSKTEVINYFIWRQKDAIRNSISATAQAHFSQKQLHHKTMEDMKKMLLDEKNVDWEQGLPPHLKYGTSVYKNEDGVWVFQPSPIFTQDRDFLSSKIKLND